MACVASFSTVSTSTNALFHLDQCPHHDIRIQMTSDSLETCHCATDFASIILAENPATIAFSDKPDTSAEGTLDMITDARDYWFEILPRTDYDMTLSSQLATFEKQLSDATKKLTRLETKKKDVLAKNKDRLHAASNAQFDLATNFSSTQTIRASVSSVLEYCNGKIFPSNYSLIDLCNKESNLMFEAPLHNDEGRAGDERSNEAERALFANAMLEFQQYLTSAREKYAEFNSDLVQLWKYRGETVSTMLKNTSKFVFEENDVTIESIKIKALEIEYDLSAWFRMPVYAPSGFMLATEVIDFALAKYVAEDTSHHPSQAGPPNVRSASAYTTGTRTGAEKENTSYVASVPDSAVGRQRTGSVISATGSRANASETASRVLSWARRYSVEDGAAGSAEVLVGDDSEALFLRAGHMNTSSAIRCQTIARSTDTVELFGSTAMLISPDFLAEKMCGHVSTVTPSSVLFSAAAAYFESESGIGVSTNRSTCAVLSESLLCSYAAISVHFDTVAAGGPTCLAIVALFALLLLLQFLPPIISPPFCFRRHVMPHSATTLRASGAYAAFAACAFMLPATITSQVSRLCRVVAK
jgi:hypothetical protein